MMSSSTQKGRKKSPPPPKSGAAYSSSFHSSNLHPNNRQALVAQDLLAALQDDEEMMCDVNLIGSGACEVPANRFVLAARSPIFRKMLYGQFREAKSASICLLGYSQDVLKAVVHFCSFHKLPDDCSDNDVCRLVQISQAADYLQLPALVDMAEKRVKRQMARDPSISCEVLQQAVLGSNLANAALLTIECRPYVTLGEHACGLSSEKLELILQNSALGAGEWFLFQTLKHWYEHQDNQKEAAKVAQKLCEQYISLTDIEPAKLLSPEIQECDFVTPSSIFAAVASQALRASQNKSYRSLGRGAVVNNNSKLQEERILVENCGSPDVNGMYYKLTAACGNNNDLYSKRETICGQEYVYTLSRCLITSTPPPSPNNSNNIDGGTALPYYELRIFGSKFLTHNTVRDFQIMQSTNSIVPFFQPVMQVLEVTPPVTIANGKRSSITTSASSLFMNDSWSSSMVVVPSPIRKYYRVKLSDGEHYMPGTLARDVSAALIPDDDDDSLKENHVIQVLEFGLYTMDGGCTGIHIIKAVVVTTAPEHCFGDPVPLDVSSSPPSSVHVDDDNDGEDDSEDDDEASLQQEEDQSASSKKGLRNMYHCQVPVSIHQSQREKIPPTGWEVDVHGVSPAPLCTWIPAVEKDDDSADGSTTTDLVSLAAMSVASRR